MKKKFKISIQKDFLINYTVFKKPNEWKWSDDDSKIISAKIKFYKSTFLKLNLYLHLKMLIQFLKIFFKDKIKKIIFYNFNHFFVLIFLLFFSSLIIVTLKLLKYFEILYAK